MKFLLFTLVIAIMASSALGYGRRVSSGRTRNFFGRHSSIDMKRVMYAAGGSTQCDLCEMVVKEVQSVLSGEKDEIENFLDSLCSDLPSEYSANCTNLVNTYLPLLFTLIDDMTPEEVCELLTLCTGENAEMPSEITDRESLTSFFNHYLARMSRVRALKERRIQYMRSLVGENFLCEACEETIGYVHDFVACNQTWDQIAQLLQPLCELCPSEYRSSCLRFFQELPGDVNEFADTYLDPSRDCEILGFCPEDDETVSPTQAPEVPQVEPDVPVEVPVAVRSQRINVNMNDRLYDGGFSKRQYKKIPKPTKNMKRMGIRGMDRMRRPRSIVVHVAGETNNRIQYDIFETATQHYETVPAQKKCEVCRYFSSAAEGVIQYNQVDITNGLTTLFIDICNVMPDQFKDDCESEIEDVLPGVIYQMLLKVMNPDYLCGDLIGICQ